MKNAFYTGCNSQIICFKSKTHKYNYQQLFNPLKSVFFPFELKNSFVFPDDY